MVRIVFEGLCKSKKIEFWFHAGIYPTTSSLERCRLLLWWRTSNLCEWHSLVLELWSLSCNPKPSQGIPICNCLLNALERSEHLISLGFDTLAKLCIRASPMHSCTILTVTLHWGIESHRTSTHKNGMEAQNPMNQCKFIAQETTGPRRQEK